MGSNPSQSRKVFCQLVVLYTLDPQHSLGKPRNMDSSERICIDSVSPLSWTFCIHRVTQNLLFPYSWSLSLNENLEVSTHLNPD